MAKSKMLQGIEQALHLVAEGTYSIKDGNLYRGDKKLGSVDKISKNIFVVVKGIDILLPRLAYAYYNGNTADSLLDKHGIHHLDGDKQNNTANNLVQLPRAGYKKALEALRVGLACELPKDNALTAVAPTAKQPQEDTPQALTEEEVKYSEKELQARNILKDVIAGELTMKEIAKKYGVKPQKIYDIKNGKSSKRATADLREAL